MVVFGVIMGFFLLAPGITALLCGQPYHVWCPFILVGGMMIVIFSSFFPILRKQYKQAELRRMQALDM
jgi:hypothetical protein